MDKQPTEEEQTVFELLPDAIPVLKSDYELRQKLLQWNLSDRLKLLRFRVRRRVASEEDERRLICDFLQDSDVQSLLGVNAAANEWIQGAGPSALDTPQGDGSLRRCFDETFDGCSVSDLLREMLVNPDSQHCDLFSPDDEQQEFFFKIFRALVVGGPLCQSDDKLQPYEDAARTLYKALVSVKKNVADRSAIDVTSHAYEVDECSSIFKSESPLHSCFVVVDPKKRWLTIWYHHPDHSEIDRTSTIKMPCSEEEEAATKLFLETLLADTTKDGADTADVEYLIERIVPPLVPAIVHLLKAVVASRQRETDEDEGVQAINPLNHLARHLLRHNPRFNEPEDDSVELQAMVRKILRK